MLVTYWCRYISLVAAVAAAASPKSSEEYINILGGTSNLFDFSFGNVLPETQMPWGFNGFAPETDGTGTDVDSSSGFWFYAKSFRFFGMRLTHQPSPWCKDYGNMRFFAYASDGGHGDANSASAYDPRASTWLPYYQKHTMRAYCNAESCLTLELTATEHGAIMRFRFPKDTSSTRAAVDGGWKTTRRVEITMNTKITQSAKHKPWLNDTVQLGESGADRLTVLTGLTTRSDAGGPTSNDMKFAHYFHATIASGHDGSKAASLFRFGHEGNDTGKGFADFQPEDVADDTLVLRVATSMISPAQARANHKDEVAGETFETALAKNREAWRRVTSRVEIADVGAGYSPQEADDWKTIFYSSMYRAAKYPRNLWETDHQTGKPIHWSPDSGRTQAGVFSVDSGFWDGYRTTYSWLALLYPERLAEAMQGWLTRFDESGWVPQWSHPSSVGGMSGTMSDVSLSEAIVKLPHCAGTSPIAGGHGLSVPAARSRGYCVNASGLYAASRKNAFVDPRIPGTAGNNSGGNGRACLTEYASHGFIPLECTDARAPASTSMNYWHSDWAIGRAAKLLNHTGDAEALQSRSERWTSLFDPQIAFFRPRFGKNGTFHDGFDEFAWGPDRGYTEAGPWQYRFEVPYAPTALKKAMAASGFESCELVQQANSGSGAFHFGGYSAEIHEMSEMAINSWGQWELNNQPVWALQHMQIAFDTSVTGRCAGQAQYWLRRSNRMLMADAEMYPGDEDNGSMGAWFMFNMIGLYPLSPASGDYVIGSPLFANITLDVGAAQPLVVLATNQAPDNVYVHALTWRGNRVSGVSISYEQLMQGGVLHFVMGSSPAYSPSPHDEI
jgi:predicted alpha-1,2-mannosidase